MKRELNSFPQIPLFYDLLLVCLNLPWGVENRLSRIITLGWTPCSIRTFTASITVLPVPDKWVGEKAEVKYPTVFSNFVCQSHLSFRYDYNWSLIVAQSIPNSFWETSTKELAKQNRNLEKNSQLSSISWRFKNLWNST